MKQLFTCLFVLSFGIGASAQTCNCLNELQYVESNAEQNLPSYHDQVITLKREKEYNKHKEACNKIAATLKDNTECVYLLAKYLAFFRDEHLSVNYKESYYPFSWEENDSAAKRAFFLKEKIYALPAPPANPKGIEGLWESKDKKYIVQIVKDKSLNGNYAALIVEANKQYWSKGQLKFRLKTTGTNRYEAIYLAPSRQPRIYTAVLNDSVLAIGRVTLFYRKKATSSAVTEVAAPLDNKPSFRSLSAQTNYLCVPDFDYDLHTLIDSVVRTNLTSILSKPNLIIDVRNNGGGGDRSYAALLPLVLEQKLCPNPISVSFFATPDIIQHYNGIKYQNCETKADSLDDDATIALMERYKGSYTPIEPDTLAIDTVYRYPLKVAILMNRWCGSSTEGFILKARQSKRVKLYGENTWGMCGYGDWRPVNPPCLPVEISMPTKKMVFANHEDFESIGIPPATSLTTLPETEWLDKVMKDMERK